MHPNDRHGLTLLQILESSLFPQDEECSDAEVKEDGNRARPPYNGIASKINLFVVLDPEVLLDSAMHLRENMRTLTMPRLSRGQLWGLESYACRSVKAAFVRHMTACSSKNFSKKDGFW